MYLFLIFEFYVYVNFNIEFLKNKMCRKFEN